MLELQDFFYKLLISKKIMWMVGPLCELTRICYQNSLQKCCKKICGLKESMILFKRNKM